MKKKTDFLSITGLSFLIISLIAVAATVSDPVKKQLIAIFASTDPVGVNYKPIGIIFKSPPPSPSSSPSPRASKSPTPVSAAGYSSLNLIINPDAAPNRPGFDCRAHPGVCPKGVTVSGFYQAANGKFYPIAQSAGGPSQKDLAYIEKNRQKDEAGNISLNQALNLPSGNAFVNPETRNLQNQIENYLARTPTPTPKRPDRNTSSPTPKPTKTPAPVSEAAIINARLKTSFPAKTITPTPTPTPVNKFGNLTATVGKKTISPTPMATQTKTASPKPTPTSASMGGRTVSPKPNMSDASLNSLIGNTDGTNPFMNPQSRENMNYLSTINDSMVDFYNSKESNVIKSPTPETGNVNARNVNVGNGKPTCPTDYILKENNLGAFYCEENPAKLDPKNWRVECSAEKCLKCSTGFFGICRSLDTATVNMPRVARTATVLKKMGDKCTGSSECGSGNCANSWTGTNGTKSFSPFKKICTFSEESQKVFEIQKSERDSSIVENTAKGLLLTNVLTTPIKGYIIDVIGTAGLSYLPLEGFLIVRNQSDIVKSFLVNSAKQIAEGPGYYSPTLDARINLVNGKFINTKTGEVVEPNSSHPYLKSNVVDSVGIQHLTITEQTFNSPAWQEIESKIKSQTANDPTNLTKITEAVNNALIYGNPDQNFFKQVEYQTMYRSLENVLSQNREICFEFMAVEQAYLATLGIPTQMVSIDSTFKDFLGSPGEGHAFLVFTDKNNKKWALDPTNGQVDEFEKYLDRRKAKSVEVYDSIYGFTNNALPEYSIISNKDTRQAKTNMVEAGLKGVRKILKETVDSASGAFSTTP